MTPDQDKTQQQLRDLILTTADQEGAYETAKGFLRYERMRTLNAVEFAQLQRRNLEGELWDDLIDRLIVKEKGL